MSRAVPEALDHLVLSAPDLEAAVSLVETRLGVRPAIGGRHPLYGSRNAVLALGERCYLEVVGPDPDGSPPSGKLPFWIGSLTAPRLTTWAAAAVNLERRREAALAAGYDPGAVTSGARDRPDGTRLTWRCLIRPEFEQPEGGLVPFLIDWGESPHPADSAPGGCRIVELLAEHPAPDQVRIKLKALGADLSLRPGARPALRARIESPAGIVTL